MKSGCLLSQTGRLGDWAGAELHSGPKLAKKRGTLTGCFRGGRGNRSINLYVGDIVHTFGYGYNNCM